MIDDDATDHLHPLPMGQRLQRAIEIAYYALGLYAGTVLKLIEGNDTSDEYRSLAAVAPAFEAELAMLSGRVRTAAPVVALEDCDIDALIDFVIWNVRNRRALVMSDAADVPSTVHRWIVSQWAAESALLASEIERLRRELAIARVDAP